jgi:hypothetical protein
MGDRERQGRGSGRGVSRGRESRRGRGVDIAVQARFRRLHPHPESRRRCRGSHAPAGEEGAGRRHGEVTQEQARGVVAGLELRRRRDKGKEAREAY